MDWEPLPASNGAMSTPSVWRNELCEVLNDMRQSGDMCDVFLTGFNQDLHLPAHSCIISAASPVIHSSLSSQSGESKIILKLEFDGSVLNTILDFIYTGELLCASHDLPRVQEAALFLHINSLLYHIQESQSAETELLTVNCLTTDPQQSELIWDDLAVQYSQVSDVLPTQAGDQLKDEDTTENVEESASPGRRQRLRGGISCPTCGKHFRKRLQLDIHMVVHSDARDYSCELCGKMFKFKSSVKNHMARHKEKQFGCQECQKRFHVKSDLEAHVLKVHNKSHNHNCQVCGKGFEQADALALHLYRRHQVPVDGLDTYSCTECSRTFPTPSHLEAHVKDRHEALFQCEQCGEKFSLKNVLKKHLNSTHGGEGRSVWCLTCKTSFNLSALPLHQHRDAYKSKRCACEHCDYVTLKAIDLVLHMQEAHPGVSVVKDPDHQVDTAEALSSPAVTQVSGPLTNCPTCHKHFRTPKALFKHQVDAHQEFYKCDHPGCEFVSHDARGLGGHQKIHRSCKVEESSTSTSKQKVPKCPQCSKIFPSQSEVVRHVRQSHGVRFECPLCEDNFYLYQQCQAHISTSHSSEQVPRRINRRLFHCSVCSKSFPTMLSLQRHQLRVHRQKQQLTCAYDGCGYIGNYLEVSRHEQEHWKHKEFRKRGTNKVTHSSIKLPCPSCGFLFRRHIFKTHVEICQQSTGNNT